MKYLEKFFETNGFKGITHGVIYNQGEVKEITFWDENGKEYRVKDFPTDIEEGIVCFKEENGGFKICN